MKIFARLSAFALTLMMGIHIVSLRSWVISIPPIPSNVSIDDDLANRVLKSEVPEGLRVMYAGTESETSDEWAYLRFVVYNGTSGKVFYGAKGAKYAFPTVRINGIEVPEQYRCGSGAMRYSIEPGASAELYVGVYEFEKVPKNNDLITVGFYLRGEHFDNSDEIVSEPFLLPQEFKAAIKKHNQNLIQVEE